jgi:hypothetical protein
MFPLQRTGTHLVYTYIHMQVEGKTKIEVGHLIQIVAGVPNECGGADALDKLWWKQTLQ